MREQHKKNMNKMRHSLGTIKQGSDAGGGGRDEKNHDHEVMQMIRIM